uniref:Uncharacterized protein n=1 Tax=Musa acuminata subsp. malaccensis TaxID=214687 RepID=A0A804KJG1_MUSAM
MSIYQGRSVVNTIRIQRRIEIEGIERSTRII